MIDFVLVGVIIVLLGYMAWDRYETKKERSKLINAIIAKTPEQLRDLEFVDKANPPKREKPTDQFIEPQSLSDEEWKETIIKNNG